MKKIIAILTDSYNGALIETQAKKTQIGIEAGILNAQEQSMTASIKREEILREIGSLNGKPLNDILNRIKEQEDIIYAAEENISFLQRLANELESDIVIEEKPKKKEKQQ